MRLAKAALVLLVFSGLLTACLPTSESEDDNGNDTGIDTGVVDAGLVGTWDALEMLFESQVDTASIELIGEGYTCVIVVGDDAAYTLTLTPPEGGVMSESGTLTILGSTLTTTEGGETGDPIAFAVVGDTLTLDNSNSDWDFYGDGEPENADSHWVFLKR